MREKKLRRKQKTKKTQNMPHYYWHSSLDHLGKLNKTKKEISSQQTDFRTQFLQ